MTKKRSLEIFGVRIEKWKTFFREKFVPPPPNSAPSLRSCWYIFTGDKPFL